MKVPADPPVGCVIAYEYLWASQADVREDGAKVYPAAVILARILVAQTTLAYVVGISHRRPGDGERALPVPGKLKQWLGLDHQPAWVYTDQLNVFAWPGPDLRPAHYLSTRQDAKDTCVIGPLPTDWFRTVTTHVYESRQVLRLKSIKRS